MTTPPVIPMTHPPDIPMTHHPVIPVLVTGTAAGIVPRRVPVTSTGMTSGGKQ